MPCMCWYHPEEEEKAKIKAMCFQLVQEIKRLEEVGDPIGCRIDDVHKLLDHLYNPKSCKEKPKLSGCSPLKDN